MIGPNSILTRNVTRLAVVIAMLVPLVAGAADGGQPWVVNSLTEEEEDLLYGSQEDQISLEEAREFLLDLINHERRQAGVSELRESPVAVLLAQDHAGEMAVNGYASHYSPQGLKCERRFNLLGQTDHVDENISYYEIERGMYLHHEAKYIMFLTPQLVRRLHGHWMESDSHRRNILDPAHTHVGTGISIEWYDGRSLIGAVEEFVNDYGDSDRLPLETSPGTVVAWSGYLDPGRAVLKYIAIGREPLPEPVQDFEDPHLSRGYSQPEAILALIPKQYQGNYVPPVDERQYTVDYSPGTGDYTVTLKTTEHWPDGAYYITLWAERPDGTGNMFRAATQVLNIQSGV